ncbi:trypsin-like [Pelodiscus sinensis]|uniref:trypsin-like n=1 Tax=Pelodiscus sinensis TaxID=13735 RepID=UPI003F6D8CB9
MEWLGVALLLVTAVSGFNPRIIGGAPCEPHSKPWQAALFVGSQLSCGGTLIDKNWVITAAHCNIRCILTVRLGEHNIRKLDFTEQLRLSAKMIIHPKYNSASKDNDIMLIKLLTPANINRNVQPLALPTSCPAAGQDCVVSGWGTTKSPELRFPPVLYCGNISVFSQEQCRSIYPRYFTKNMFCAGLPQGGVDSCQGDSGGPLVCNGVLQGIVSWGTQTCALPNKPGVYVNICNYIDWIRETINNN